ncbi:MAG: cytochrome c [Pseudomonadales bacterium]|nr:cytochrome c [Pseudomonadales bacterium]
MTRNPLIRNAMIFSLLLGFGSASWGDDRAEKAIEARQGLLKVVAQYFGPIVGMAKGQIPYDAAKIEANAGNIAELAAMIPDMFAMDTRASGIASGAKGQIWADNADFNDKAQATAESAQALVMATAEGRGAAMKAIGALGASCKSCHDNYRQKN